MNNIDKTYLELCQDILDNGTKKKTRTGTDSISVFGRQIRHKMSEGFPLLTTKKMYWKGVVAELLWFLRGETNIKYLLENDCHIWDGDAYKRYYNSFPDAEKSFQYEGSTIETRRMTKEEFIDMIKTDSEFAAQWGNLGPIYGKQWRRVMVPYNMMVIDQISNLINELKTNPDSRRLMVNAWNVTELDLMVLPPCHYGFQLYTRELSLQERCNEYIKWSNDPKWVEWKNHIEKEMGWDYEKPNWVFDEVRKGLDEAQFPTRAISLMWNQRSCDFPLGIPFNIASYALLLEIIAKITNMIPDELVGNLGDCHIYENQIDGIKEQMNREPYELSSLRINTEFWPTETGEAGIGNLINNIDWLIRGMEIDDFQIEGYQSHASIKIPLSN